MSRKKKSPFRFSFRVSLDLLSAAKSLLGAVSALALRPSAARADECAWMDVPIGALVLVEGGRVPCLLLRSTPDSGAMVGTLDAAGKPTCDDAYEHEPWTALRRRRGAETVTVLARRVKPTATAAMLEAAAKQGLP